jgi:hypothetical protein
MRSTTALLVLVTTLFANAELQHGVIGMGIDMFMPWCATACSDTLSGLYLNCTTFEQMSGDHHGMKVKRMDGMDMMMGVTSADCRASDTPWLQTFSYCIKSHCDAEGLSAEEQEKYWQKNAAEGMPVPSMTEALPTTAPSLSVENEAEWLNETMLANEVAWTTDRRTIQEFAEVERDHSIFAYVSRSLT